LATRDQGFGARQGGSAGAVVGVSMRVRTGTAGVRGGRGPTGGLMSLADAFQGAAGDGDAAQDVERGQCQGPGPALLQP